MAQNQSSSHYAQLSNTINESLVTDLKDDSVTEEYKSFERRFTYQKSCLSTEQMQNRITFLEKNPPLNTWHSHWIVSTLICFVCINQTFMQIQFFLSADAPYNWISVAFFSLNHLIFGVEWMIFIAIIMSKTDYYLDKTTAFLLFILGMILCPS